MNRTHPLLAALTALLLPTLLVCCQGTIGEPASSGPIASRPPGVAKRADIVKVGDVLDIYVMEDSTLNGQFAVRESGNIIMPRIGRVYLAGSSLASAQEIVRSKVESEQIKKATVILERVRTSDQAGFADSSKMVVIISGAVNKPGQHRVPISSPDGVSAFEAVMIAGGPSTYADQHRAYVLRKTGDGARQRYPVDLIAVSKGEARDFQLQDGDMIVVPQRRFGL